jgi:hypothetical protein
MHILLRECFSADSLETFHIGDVTRIVPKLELGRIALWFVLPTLYYLD